MAILPLVIAPDERLNQASKPVTDINDKVRALLDDMLDTMYANQGIGLAAVQIGVLETMLVVDVGVMTDEKKPIKIINPKVLESSDELSSYEEGCLSFPGQYSQVQRPAYVKIEYLDENGTPQTLEAEGVMAVCIQHEIDHTQGTVFVDHISKLKRDMILKRLTKAKKLGTLPARNAIPDDQALQQPS